MEFQIRPMTCVDVIGAAEVQSASFRDYDLRHGEDAPEPTSETWERIQSRHRHFLAHDPEGAWVATIGDRVVGTALALKRELLWGLSLLAISPDAQSGGIGSALLAATLTYAEGCRYAVIISSLDPRAMRAYAGAGFALYPGVVGKGKADLAAMPASVGRVREGSVGEVELADQVDRHVRDAARGPDQRYLAERMSMFVVDDSAGRGYTYVRNDGTIVTIAATDDDTATALLWRALAHCLELAEPATLDHINGGQQWAISAAYAARLTVSHTGCAFWRGRTPPASYIPSGGFL